MAARARKQGRGSPRRSTGRDRTRSAAAPRARSAAPVLPPAETFALGAIPGATPGKWIDVWHERMPRTRLELREIAVAAQIDALRSGDVDAALVRLPIDRDGLHAIALYDEIPVVVIPADSALTAADELQPEDLADEVLIRPADDVLCLTVPGTRSPSFATPETTGEAVELVAAGVGILIVPMSLARRHHRKDVEFRPLAGGPLSTVALAWRAEHTTPEVEAFVGIVRGRTPNSSRG